MWPRRRFHYRCERRHVLYRAPPALEEKFAAITALTDTFCDKYLTDEYRVLIHRVARAA